MPSGVSLTRTPWEGEDSGVGPLWNGLLSVGGVTEQEAYLQTAPEASGHTTGGPGTPPTVMLLRYGPCSRGAQVALCPLLPIVKGQDGVARASTGSQRQLCMVPVTIIGPAWLQLERRGLEPVPSTALSTKRPSRSWHQKKRGSADCLDQLIFSPLSFLDHQAHPAAQLRPGRKRHYFLWAERWQQ